MTDYVQAPLAPNMQRSTSTSNGNGRKTQTSYLADEFSVDAMEYTPSLQSQYSLDPNGNAVTLKAVPQNERETVKRSIENLLQQNQDSRIAE